MSETAEIWLEELRQREAEGFAEGIAKGEAEIINRMLNKGLTLEQISEFTNYTVDEIKDIIRLADIQ